LEDAAASGRVGDGGLSAVDRQDALSGPLVREGAIGAGEYTGDGAVICEVSRIGRASLDAQPSTVVIVLFGVIGTLGDADLLVSKEVHGAGLYAGVVDILSEVSLIAPS
jgi:hypothetical protein